jgi:hypothetical protein
MSFRLVNYAAKDRSAYNGIAIGASGSFAFADSAAFFPNIGFVFFVITPEFIVILLVLLGRSQELFGKLQPIVCGVKFVSRFRQIVKTSR